MIHRVTCLVATLLLVASALGAEPFESFEDPELQARYLALIQEVRCLTCLNRSIAESETPLAADLRREIRELMADGASDKEVQDFLTARYGDFVLYRPPLRPSTIPIWIAPAVMLLVGSVVFVRVVRKRLAQPIDDDDAEEEIE
jgi:cytochrome c-type biogenesis protein CcmH